MAVQYMVQVLLPVVVLMGLNTERKERKISSNVIKRYKKLQIAKKEMGENVPVSLLQFPKTNVMESYKYNLIQVILKRSC